MKVRMKAVSLIVLVTFITTLLFPESFYLYSQDKRKESSQKINVAVWNFDSQGVSKTEALTISQRFRSKLVETKIFNVVEKGRMEEILNEQGFQMTGCTSAECMVDAGKVLNVQKMITGLIGKVGFTYTLDIRIIDIESAKIEKTVTRDYKGSIDGLLGYLDEIAKEIAGIIVLIKPNYWIWITSAATIGVATLLYFILKPEEEKPLKGPPALPN